MNIKQPTMDEAASRFWATFFAAVTAIGLVAGGVYTLAEYFQAKRRDAAARVQELENNRVALQAATLPIREPYYVKRVELCIEVSNAVATIATTHDPLEQRKATGNFWRLYWGPLGIVEDAELASALVAFGDCLNGSCARPMKFLSQDISRRCRAEIALGFNMHLDAVPQRPTTALATPPAKAVSGVFPRTGLDQKKNALPAK